MTNWCPLPWMSISLRNNGDLRLCVHSNQGYDHGLNRKPDGTVYNAAADNMHDARNSQMMRQVRLDMLAGKWNDACKRCMIESTAGRRSRNQEEVENWASLFDLNAAIESTDTDGSINPLQVPVLYYDIRFGNKCNIKCRSCSPTESSFWYEDYVSLWGHTGYTESFGKVRLVRSPAGKLEPVPNQYNWHELDNFWNYMDTADGFKKIHMVGGEPTLIDEHYQFLERCIDKGISKQIEIEYNTNLVKIPPRAWELWREFRTVYVGASVDGIGPVNEYIRHPTRWESVEHNLNRLDTDNTINIVPWISHTVMAYNIFYMPETLEYFMRKQYNRISMLDVNNPLMSPHPLYRPEYLCIQALPPHAKRRISDRLDKKKTELLLLADQLYDDEVKQSFVKSGIERHLTFYKEFMNQKDITDKADIFWKFTNKLDEIRNESISKALPEFYDILMEGQ